MSVILSYLSYKNLLSESNMIVLLALFKDSINFKTIVTPLSSKYPKGSSNKKILEFCASALA